MKRRGPARSMRWTTIPLLASILAGPAFAQQTEHEGANAIGLALRRLGTTKRLLMVGAHPDDENTAVLAYHALRDGADVAYLSLTRGEGGQNLIGPELQEALGLIRTEELLAARRLDGAEQYFTRAYDFGFSKSAAESFRHWPHDSLLADVVEIVRRFRPDVIISTFSGTPADGHGQHQVAGILARESYTAAGDVRFATAELGPHRATSLWRSLYRPAANAQLQIETGAFDPVFGRSHHQIAMASRSRHRSQDMGTAEPIGDQRTSILFLAGSVAEPSGLFDGVDSTLSLRASGAGGAIVARLEAYEREVDAAKAAFNPLRTSTLVTSLARALSHLAVADSLAGTDTRVESLRFHLAEEREQAERALALAAGAILDVTADTRFATIGQSFTLTIRLWNGGSTPLTVRAVEPALPDGWTVQPLDAAATGSIAGGEIATRRFRVRVPRDARPSNPYFLRRPRSGDLYVWPRQDEVRGLPFAPDPVRAMATVEIDGARVRLETPASFIEVDKAMGEVRQPIRVVPGVSVTIAPRTRVVPLSTATGDNGTFPLDVSLTTREDRPLDGTVVLELPSGWSAAPERAPVTLDPDGEPALVRFRVTAPGGPGMATVNARVDIADGRSFREGYRVIDYPHTQPRLLFEPARAEVSAFHVAIAPGLRVGYIEGAGDDGALALEQLGAQVERLGAEDLASRDLSRYDAIVAGIRAYEVRPDLIEHNARILDYARRGGTLIIQYNKYEYPEGDFAPYPFTMAQPHGRVTDEAAPVRILDADNPLLSSPNRITDADFEGWVQERGLYFAETWDDRYTPLLEMHDEGEPPLRGSLLVARVGDGVAVYTGLALFRQWPAGVPGAYRLLANLVSLGNAMETPRQPRPERE